MIVLIMLVVGALTAFMGSTAITAMFILVVLTITGRTGLNRKRMLMPLSVAATIGGMMTLISSLPNMIVANTLSARGLPQIGFFSVTTFGLSVLVAGIPFMLLARGLLSKQPTAEIARKQALSAYDLLDSYGMSSRCIPAGCRGFTADRPDDRATALALRSIWRHACRLRETRKRTDKFFQPSLPETKVETGDAIFVTFDEELIQGFTESEHLIELSRLDEHQAHETLQELGVAEIMLAPDSKLIALTRNSLFGK